MGVKIDRVIDIEVEDEKIMKRLSGADVFVNCGASYHLEYKPSANRKANATNAAAIQYSAKMTILIRSKSV